MKYPGKPVTTLQLWEFDQAPPKLRHHIPHTHSGGWVALISPGGPEEVVQELMDRWLSAGFSIKRYESGRGIVLSGSPICS